MLRNAKLEGQPDESTTYEDGLYESPEQVDDEIRKQREEWDY